MPITETSQHIMAMFENTIAYNEYRVWFPTNRGNQYYVAVGDVQFGGFFVSGINVQLAIPYPTSSFCSASNQCGSGYCHGDGYCE
mmetsp:Transcript_18093/g.22991  ORF Transcript_18093/g.22991 Transcript_18093/m.22991 type:complete len:85 (+) Transcript_18093:1757-2011(+)